ncbi:unnamed protein product, partial [Mycena citricolor]
MRTESHQSTSTSSPSPTRYVDHHPLCVHHRCQPRPGLPHRAPARADAEHGSLHGR